MLLPKTRFHNLRALGRIELVAQPGPRLLRNLAASNDESVVNEHAPI
jgi:hypothetical protein